MHLITTTCSAHPPYLPRSARRSVRDFPCRHSPVISLRRRSIFSMRVQRPRTRRWSSEEFEGIRPRRDAGLRTVYNLDAGAVRVRRFARCVQPPSRQPMHPSASCPWPLAIPTGPGTAAPFRIHSPLLASAPAESVQRLRSSFWAEFSGIPTWRPAKRLAQGLT